jgi:hypothetical protein
VGTAVKVQSYCRGLLLFYVAAHSPLLKAAGPDCTEPDRWQTASALMKLHAAGVVRATDLDLRRTKTIRLASELESAGRYRQIHETIFVTTSGRKIRVITSSLASADECSESGVEVFVVSKHLPP